MVFMAMPEIASEPAASLPLLLPAAYAGLGSWFSGRSSSCRPIARSLASGRITDAANG